MRCKSCSYSSSVRDTSRRRITFLCTKTHFFCGEAKTGGGKFSSFLRSLNMPKSLPKKPKKALKSSLKEVEKAVESPKKTSKRAAQASVHQIDKKTKAPRKSAGKASKTVKKKHKQVSTNAKRASRVASFVVG